MPDYFYQITDLNDNIKGEIRDKALTDLETAANAGKFVQISGNQTLTAVDESIFIAVYGTTTAAEVQAAINAGKLVMAMKSDGQSIAPLCGIASTVYSFCYSAPNATANTGYPWFSMWTLNRSTNSWNTVHTTQVAKRENPDLTGTPTAPTAAAGTNTTQIATTAFVQTAINNADDAEILTYGDTSVTYADITTKVAAGKVLFTHYSDSSDNVTLPYVCTTTSGNHVFTNMVGNTRWTIYLSNTDTWSIASAALAPLASPSFTGNPTAPTQAAGNNSTRIATTAFVKTAIDNAGSSTLFVTVTYSNYAYTADTTYTDMMSAISAGKDIVVILVDSNQQKTWYYTMTYAPKSGSSENFCFATENETGWISHLLVNAGNSWWAATEIDLSSYAKKASPTFTGTPKAPTAAAGTNTTQIATTAFVSSAITNDTIHVTKAYAAGTATSYEVRYAKFLIDNSTNSSAVPDAANKIIWFYE